jgi:nicotinamide-nucleotide amidase
MQDLVEQLANLLEAKNMTLVTAESCTGGLLAATITHRPGTSKVFERGFVTYTNEAKIESIGVPKEVIDNHGAVSKECAEAMAKGALEHSKAQLALSITGIAGPDGATETKPIGLVYFGYATKKKSGALSQNFKGDRNEIQTQATRFSLQHMISVLKQSA